MKLTAKLAFGFLAAYPLLTLFSCTGSPTQDAQPQASGGSGTSWGVGPATDPSEDTDADETEGPAVGSLPDPTTIDCRTDGDGLTTLVFSNGCKAPVTFAGSDLGGGSLQPGAFICVDIGTDREPIDSKRYWGFVGEDPGAEHHTLAEFTFNTDFYDFDWYNISHVDAHNLPLQIVPVARADCEVLTCEESWLETCPAEGQHRNAEGQVIACVSPDRDDAESPVARFFERCDDAYAWSGDDQQGEDQSPMRACAGEDWDIVFCPEAER